MVETIPELSYGKIIARLVNIVGDSAGDPDKYPDAVPITTGTITLTPPVPSIKIASATPVPVTAGMAKIPCSLDSAGYLVYNGDRFVWGLATDDPAQNPHGLPWHVSFDGLKDASNNTVQIEGYDFYLPTFDAAANEGLGNAVDLTLVAPLTTTPEGVIITKGDKGDPGIRWRGLWSTGVSYAAGDAVYYAGSSYIANAANSASAPPSAPWDLLAQQGSGGTGGGAVDSVNGQTGAVTLAAADVGAVPSDGSVDPNTYGAAKSADLDNTFGIATAAQTTANAAIPATQKGSALGVATLDSAGQIPAAQIPALAITEFLGSVVSQAAMLALTGQKGDWTIRTDASTVWIITGTDPTQLASWTQVVYPASPVSSVAGRQGAVTLTSADLTDRTATGAALFAAANAAAARTAIGAEPTIATGTTAQYIRGDKSLATLNAAAIGDSGAAGRAVLQATTQDAARQAAGVFLLSSVDPLPTPTSGPVIAIRARA